MHDESVAVPAATARSAVALHRPLGRRGIRTIGVTADESAPSFRSRYCDETAVVPSPAADRRGYGEALLSLAERPDVLTVAPMREPDVYLLSKHREAFAAHVATPWPDFETLRTVHDRELLFDAAREAGVPVPETHLLGAVDDWTGEHVVRPRYAFLAAEYGPARSDGNDADASARFLDVDERPDPSALRSAFGHEPHVQRFVRGPEYSVAAIYDEGERVATAQKRIIRGEKYYCGPSVYHEQVDTPEFAAVGTRLLDSLGWHGPADVDHPRRGDRRVQAAGGESMVLVDRRQRDSRGGGVPVLLLAAGPRRVRPRDDGRRGRRALTLPARRAVLPPERAGGGPPAVCDAVGRRDRTGHRGLATATTRVRPV